MKRFCENRAVGMKLRDVFVEIWEERYKIYRLDGNKANGAAIVLDGENNNRFLAAFSCVEEAREFVCGWSKRDCEGNLYRLNNGSVERCKE